MPQRHTRRPLAHVIAAAVVVAACSSGVSTSSPGAEPTATPVATPGVTARPSPTPAPVVGTGEAWMLFQQFPSKSEVMVARLDGSDLHSAIGGAAGTGDETNADWSPDGSRIVLVVGVGEREELWTADADGSNAQQLAACIDECRFLDDPDWSPDGRTVLYSRHAEAADGAFSSSLERVDVATGAIEVVVRADPGFAVFGQRFSPDGRFVVLEILELSEPRLDAEYLDVRLAVIDLAAPTPHGRALTETGTWPETAAWAPSGDVIVFAALEAAGADGTDLFAINVDGSSLRRLTTLVDEGGSATHPDVSADGIVYFAATISGHGTVLAKVDLAGGEVTPALGDAYVEGVHPRIRPLP